MQVIPYTDIKLAQADIAAWRTCRWIALGSNGPTTGVPVAYWLAAPVQ